MRTFFNTFTIFFTALIFICLVGVNAYADGIVLLGPNNSKLVPPLTVLDLSHQGNSSVEAGGVAWDGSQDVRFGPGKFVSGPHNQTVTFNQTGATNAGNLGIIFNINQNNGHDQDFVVLNSLVLTAYDQNGKAVFSASLVGGPLTLEQFEPAQGSTADYVFGLDSAAATRLQAVLAANPNLHFGLFANISAAQGGPERFGFTGLPSQPTTVPEPATLLLLGTGLAGVAAKVRQRK